MIEFQLGLLILSLAFLSIPITQELVAIRKCLEVLVDHARASHKEE